MCSACGVDVFFLATCGTGLRRFFVGVGLSRLPGGLWQFFVGAVMTGVILLSSRGYNNGETQTHPDVGVRDDPFREFLNNRTYITRRGLVR